MRLVSLSLQNFRQHAQSFIGFAPGLTGIIGANGSGKSTILEGLGFALYGTAATRGKKEGIKFTRAQSRATVRVELVFDLAGHRYRVVRGLSTAECYLDQAETPIANTLTGVTDMLQRTLGMSREEFFATYFTGQKELAMMASMSPTDRGKFLQRVLGYDRIGEAQELVRDRRKLLVAELTGLRANMQNGEDLAMAVKQSEERVTVATDAVERWRAEHETAAAEVEAARPAWVDAQARQNATHQLTMERQSATFRMTGFEREIQRLTAAIEESALTEVEAANLLALVVDLPARRAQLLEMETEAAAYATRQNVLGVQETLQQALVRIDARLANLVHPDSSTVVVTSIVIAKMRVDVSAAEDRYNEARDRWTNDVANERGNVQHLRDRHEALTHQRAQLLEMGEESPCATCGQRVGARLSTLVQEIEQKLETVSHDGRLAKARLSELATAPAEVTVAQGERGDLSAALHDAEQRLGLANAVRAEISRLEEERAAATARLETVRGSLVELGATYDPAVHQQLRETVGSMEMKDARRTMLKERIAGRYALRAELAAAEAGRHRALIEDVQCADRLATEGILPEVFAECQLSFQAATQRATVAESALSHSVAEQTRAEESLGHQRAAQARYAELRERLTMMEHERFVLDETDRGYTDLRAMLNEGLRPELAEIASELIEVLTDGRYTRCDIDESYMLTVLEDGLAKPVLSGGEEDLCNLILRLAISQMIARRAGHAFSLLILDEVFGALDDARRANVMELLRRLNDRFEQVIVITHINQVRDGLDNILQVRYDAESGASAVVSGGASAEAADLVMLPAAA